MSSILQTCSRLCSLFHLLLQTIICPLVDKQVLPADTHSGSMQLRQYVRRNKEGLVILNAWYGVRNQHGLYRIEACACSFLLLVRNITTEYHSVLTTSTLEDCIIIGSDCASVVSVKSGTARVTVAVATTSPAQPTSVCVLGNAHHANDAHRLFVIQGR